MLLKEKCMLRVSNEKMVLVLFIEKHDLGIYFLGLYKLF